jgi:hypothetical protein
MAAAVNLLPMFRLYYELFKEEVDKNSVPFRFPLRLMAEKLVEVGVGNGVKVAAKQVIDNIDQGKDLVEQRNILIGILRDELDDMGAMDGGRKRRVKKTRKQRKTGGRSTRSRKGRLTTRRRKGGRAVEGPRKTWKQLADELKKMVREVPQDQKKYTVEEFAKRLERANIVDPTPDQQSQSDLFVTAMAFEVPALARVAYDRGARDDEQAALWEETLAEARNSDSPPEYVPVLREILSIMRPRQTPAH